MNGGDGNVANLQKILQILQIHIIFLKYNFLRLFYTIMFIQYTFYKYKYTFYTIMLLCFQNSNNHAKINYYLTFSK